MTPDEKLALFGKPPRAPEATTEQAEEPLFSDLPVRAPWTAWIREAGKRWKALARTDEYDEAWRVLLREHLGRFCEKMVLKTGKAPGD